jgi:uncharacterized protein (TIGR03066 family)
MAMKTLRLILVGTLALGVVGAAAADEKKEAPSKEKLVGTWKLIKSSEELPPGAVGTVTFTKDGKMKVSFKFGEKSVDVKGTYTLDGDKIMSNLRGPDGKEVKETSTITKLTATELATTDEKGRTEQFQKQK